MSDQVADPRAVAVRVALATWAAGDERKIRAVELVIVEERDLSAAARELGIDRHALMRWVRQFKEVARLGVEAAAVARAELADEEPAESEPPPPPLPAPASAPKALPPFTRSRPIVLAPVRVLPPGV